MSVASTGVPITLAAVLTVTVTYGGDAAAQRTRIEGDSASARACEGQRVSGIDFTPRPPVLAGDKVPGFLRPVMRTLLQHRPTKMQAVEPFVIVGEGDECTVDALAESERLLRAQPYLADAVIRATPDPAGGVRLEVETVDEIPLIIGGGIRDGSISKAKYGNGNLAGYGALASATWRQGFAYRDGFGIDLAHYHLVGRAAADVTLMRGTFDEQYGANLTRAWLTERQNTAWHVGGEHRKGYVRYLRSDEPPLSLPIERDYLDAGVLLRIGSRDLRLMGGLVASYERVEPGRQGVVIADTGFAADPDTLLAGRFPAWRDTRIGAALGGRWLVYREMIGLDSAARHDVATGVQLAMIAGQGLSSGRRAPFGMLDLYAGAGSRSSLYAVHALAEARFPSAGDWDDVVVTGHAAWYRKPSPKRIRMVRLEFSAEWDPTLPRQLTISDRSGGIRGYRDAAESGSRRAVLRLEERLSTGGFGGAAGLGVAAFADVGKLWAGDAPFGTTTGLRPSIGAGILVVAPRQSQRMYRLDVAVPLVREGPTRSWSLRLTTDMPYRAFWREPGDVRRMRAGMPASNLLAWR